MAKHKKPGPWQGNEVKPDPPGRAEQNADRAEGTERIPVAERIAMDREHEPAPRPPTPAPGQDTEENLREKRAAAAEEHQDRERTGQPSHKNQY